MFRISARRSPGVRINRAFGMIPTGGVMPETEARRAGFREFFRA